MESYNEENPVVCTHLRVLSLIRSNFFSLEKVFLFSQFLEMEELHLSGECPNKPMKHAPKYTGFIEACPNLRALTGTACCGLLKNIKNCSNLTSLNITESCSIPMKNLYILECRSPIKKLSVTHTRVQYIDEVLGLLFNPYSQIEFLTIYSNWIFSDFWTLDLSLKVYFTFSLTARISSSRRCQ